MKKISIVLVIILVVILLVVLGFAGYKFYFAKNSTDRNSETGFSYLDATYAIDGSKVTLKNGLSETPAAPGSASKIITKYFGNEAKADFNGDGREDVAFLLTQQTGGTGTFYYVVAALNTVNGYVGSEGFFLGDRIAPQTTEIDSGKTALGTNRQSVIVVNYAVRMPGEPFSVQPSLGKSVWLKLDPATMKFGEVAQNFEGESK